MNSIKQFFQHFQQMFPPNPNPKQPDNQIHQNIQISPPYEVPFSPPQSEEFKTRPHPITLTADDLRFILTELKPIDESELLGLIATTCIARSPVGCTDFSISIDPNGTGNTIHRLYLFRVGSDRPNSPHALKIARSLLRLRLN